MEWNISFSEVLSRARRQVKTRGFHRAGFARDTSSAEGSSVSYTRQQTKQLRSQPLEIMLPMGRVQLINRFFYVGVYTLRIPY